LLHPQRVDNHNDNDDELALRHNDDEPSASRTHDDGITDTQLTPTSPDDGSDDINSLGTNDDKSSALALRNVRLLRPWNCNDDSLATNSDSRDDSHSNNDPDSLPRHNSNITSRNSDLDTRRNPRRTSHNDRLDSARCASRTDTTNEPLTDDVDNTLTLTTSSPRSTINPSPRNNTDTPDDDDNDDNTLDCNCNNQPRHIGQCTRRRSSVVTHSENTALSEDDNDDDDDDNCSGHLTTPNDPKCATPATNNERPLTSDDPPPPAASPTTCDHTPTPSRLNISNTCDDIEPSTSSTPLANN
jgi:hypothetical protein